MDITARLGLRKPDGDPVTGDDLNVDDLNFNFDKIDAALGAEPCTSSTRPTGTARFNGKIIRETDTGKLLVWDGVDWLLLNDASIYSNWESWDPIWSSSGSTQPVLNSGSLVGRKKQVGQSLHVFIRLTIGTDTVLGSGDWRFTVPISPNFANQTLNAQIIDQSTGNYYPAAARISSTSPEITKIGAHSATGAIGAVSGSHPMVWANTDVLTIQGTLMLRG